jgi:Zn-dependent peptidase ImmA (M78 family)
MKMRVAGMEHARMQALTLLEKFGVESREHVRIDAFARRLGVELVVVPLQGMKAQLVVGLGRARILLPDHETDPAELQWSIAHELGHFVMGHPAPPATELLLPCPDRGTPDLRDYEREANCFASTLLCHDPVVASICDTRPMTLDVAWRLAAMCGVPWAAAARRLIEVTWRTCAVVMSVQGEILGFMPSLPFLMLCGHRIVPDQPIGAGSLARRFFDTGAPCGPPALVPASAWLADCDPEARIQEHSLEIPELGTVLTMLWDAAEADVPRPPEASFRWMPVLRDALLAEEKDPALARIRA